MLLKKLVKSLQRYDVDYAIVGGYAVALHGAVRGTVDVDLVVNVDEESLAKAERALNDIGLKSRLPVSARDVAGFRDEYIQNRNMKAWSFINADDPTEVVDIVITDSLKDLNTIKKKVAGIAITVLAIRDLIEMKRRSGRPQDLEDIKSLEKLI